MKKIFLALALTTTLWGCKSVTTNSPVSSKSKERIEVNINLIDIENDKVFVAVNAPSISTDTITFRLPRMV
ncbi:MAG: peptidase M61, partial [Flavobacterium sp.]|nr:peptidase M61 [Flavobacterium sp.]